MSKFRTHYDNLKVSRDAPAEVIQAAYRSLARKYHPDRNGSNAEGEAIMKAINASYEVLSDPVRRANHDRWIASQLGRNGSRGSTADGESGVPSGMEGNGRRPSQRKSTRRPWSSSELMFAAVYFVSAIVLLRVPSVRWLAITMLLAGWMYVKARSRQR
jgi:curved DNA-binding protein CbpA